MQAVDRSDGIPWDADVIAEHARSFDEAHFAAQITAAIERAVG